MVHERFISLATVQRELGLSAEDIFSLIKSGELPAIHLLGSWRVERAVLEQFIGRLYAHATTVLAELDRLDREDEESPGPTDASGGGSGGDDAETDTTDDSADDSAIALLNLTPQMRRVLDLVARGMSNAEIASELTLEVSTVKSHVSRLLSRLGVSNRERLIAFAWRSGVFHQED
jgi:DNA-binding NarL/FixJ family response regulator